MKTCFPAFLYFVEPSFTSTKPRTSRRANTETEKPMFLSSKPQMPKLKLNNTRTENLNNNKNNNLDWQKKKKK
jgi:hypothetical protein